MHVDTKATGTRPKSLQDKRSVAEQKHSRHSHGCTSPTCACSVVKEYTRKLMLEDIQIKAAKKRGDNLRHTQVVASPDSCAKPSGKQRSKSESDSKSKVAISQVMKGDPSSRRKSRDEACTSPSNNERHVKEERKNSVHLRNSGTTKIKDCDANVAKRNSSGQTTHAMTEADVAKAQTKGHHHHHHNPRSNPPRRARNIPYSLYDRNTIRYLARQYNVKKQPHNTKTVLVKNGPQKKREWAKYKSLVEISDSIPDLLRAALLEKEQRRDEKEDRAKTRNSMVCINSVIPSYIFITGL